MKWTTKKKPVAISRVRYYAVWPVQSVWESISDFFTGAWVAVTGGWWCEYCKKYHCRRVLKYKLTFTKEGAQVPNSGTLRNDFKYCERLVCSLGRDACHDNTWTPAEPTIGDLFNQMDDAISKFCGPLGGE